MNKDFLSWLGHTGGHTCMIENAGTTYYFVRCKRMRILTTSTASGNTLARNWPVAAHSNMLVSFAGGMASCMTHNTTCRAWPVRIHRSAAQASCGENLRQAVRRLVEAAVANDRRNLQITELSDPELLRKLKNEQDYYAKSKARERFLDAAEFEPPSFQCFYEAENWTEDSLLSYILDSQGYAAKEATDYMEGNQEEMLFDFLCNDVELAEYQALVDDRDNPVHIVKKIMAAMNTTSAKTVNVTICKDGEEFSLRQRRRSFAAIVRTITAIGIWWRRIAGNSSNGSAGTRNTTRRRLSASPMPERFCTKPENKTGT